MTITKGDVVSYESYNGYTGAAVVESIELCEPGEKYGKVVNQCISEDNPESIVCLSNHHWCHLNQITNVLSHQNN